MSKQTIPLSKTQNEIMKEFYSFPPMRVIYNKQKRRLIWDKATSRKDFDLAEIKIKCPALAHQIERSFNDLNNIQSAVFSECVYAQTLANLLGLSIFTNCYKTINSIPLAIEKLLTSYSLRARYSYSNKDKSRMLIQAGGCGGIDSALITVIDLNIYTIEFKEPWAKTSEPDLPKYKEDGKLLLTEAFAEQYPQFIPMMNEHKDLNFFELAGHNEHRFSEQSIRTAITNNYVKKFADVVCTEDKNGYLTMLPCNQISEWAEIEGEIRSAGRNAYKVWTPIALGKIIKELGGVIDTNGFIKIEKSKLGIRKQRGGTQFISGYKINTLFFVRAENCKDSAEILEFNISNVLQLNPTITAKMNFGGLGYKEVEQHYFDN
jgi:hypothetical protein